MEFRQVITMGERVARLGIRPRSYPQSIVVLAMSAMALLSGMSCCDSGERFE